MSQIGTKVQQILFTFFQDGYRSLEPNDTAGRVCGYTVLSGPSWSCRSRPHDMRTVEALPSWRVAETVTPLRVRFIAWNLKYSFLRRMPSGQRIFTPVAHFCLVRTIKKALCQTLSWWKDRQIPMDLIYIYIYIYIYIERERERER